MSTLIAAYGLVWTAFSIYLALLAGKHRRLIQRVEELETLADIGERRAVGTAEDGIRSRTAA